MDSTKDNTKKFEEIVKKKWYVQGFNACFNFIFMGPISSIVDLYNTLGYGYTETLFVFNKDYLEYYYLEDDLKNCGNEFLKRYKKNNSYFDEALKKHNACIEKIRQTIKKIEKTEISKLNKKELLKLYQELRGVYNGTASVSHIIEAITFVLEPMLKERLEKITGFGRHEKRFTEIFIALSESEKPSFVSNEQIELIQIIKAVLQDKEQTALFKKETEETILKKAKKEITEKISAHAKKFFYNQINYIHGESLKEIDYIKEIKMFMQENMNPDEKIKEEKERYEKNIQKRKELIEKLKIDKETISLIELSVKILHWQDDRKLIILSCIYYINNLLKEIAEQFSIKIEYLKRYSPYELTYEKLSNFDTEDAKARMEHYIVYMHRENNNMKTEVYTKDDYDNFIKIQKKTLVEMKDLHGSTACVGKATGKARICKTKEDIIKFKQGEILVASMTRPEFIPAMKKAAGIVTDEGGLTCHAAIISRELGIPCIVGTKIATKILKDGEFIEVNANHGIVKILESQK